MRDFCLFVLVLLLSTQVFAQSIMSDYRPNTKVDFVYREYLHDPYHTDWYSKLERKNKGKVVVYIETVGKYVESGYMSFDCLKPKSGVILNLYDWNEFGDEHNLRKVVVLPKDFKAWSDYEFEPLRGEDPPYQFYKKLRVKYCKG